MRGQWTLIVGILVAIIIAIFAVINVEPVEVNYLVGQNDWPLVLVILVSVLMGGLIVGSVGMFKLYQLQQELKQLRKKVNDEPIVQNGKGKQGRKEEKQEVPKSK